jgi:hypothetical protein
MWIQDTVSHDRHGHPTRNRLWRTATSLLVGKKPTAIDCPIRELSSAVFGLLASLAAHPAPCRNKYGPAAARHSRAIVQHGAKAMDKFQSKVICPYHHHHFARCSGGIRWHCSLSNIQASRATHDIEPYGSNDHVECNNDDMFGLFTPINSITAVSGIGQRLGCLDLGCLGSQSKSFAMSFGRGWRWTTP